MLIMEYRRAADAHHELEQRQAKFNKIVDGVRALMSQPSSSTLVCIEVRDLSFSACEIMSIITIIIEID